MTQKNYVRKIATLQHSVGYLEDTVRELNEVVEMLTEDGCESVESLLMQKRAEGSLASGLRFLEHYRKDNS